MKKKASLIVTAVALIVILLLGTVGLNSIGSTEAKKVVKARNIDRVLPGARNNESIINQKIVMYGRNVGKACSKSVSGIGYFKGLAYIDTGQGAPYILGYIEDS